MKKINYTETQWIKGKTNAEEVEINNIYTISRTSKAHSVLIEDQTSCSPDTYYHGRQSLLALTYLLEKARYESEF